MTSPARLTSLAFATLLSCKAPAPSGPCFEISAEPPGDARAQLSVTFSGEHLNLGSADCVALQVGLRRQVRRLGERLPVLDIPAASSALTRLRVGGRDLLLHVEPGARVLISDDLCFGWRIVTPRLGGDAPARIRIERAAGAPGPLVLRSAMDEDLDPGREVKTSTLSLPPSTCGFDRLSTGADTVLLGAAAGAAWALRVDAEGRLSGRVD